MIVNKVEVTDQIMKWIDTDISNPVEITYVNLVFEHRKSYSTRKQNLT